jgi:hypothetical protein
MTRTNVAKLAPAALTLAALYAACAAIAASQLMARAPATIGAGVALDLTLTAAALVYLLAVRPGHLPRRALVGVVAAGLALAHVLVPASPLTVRVLPLVGLGVEASLMVLALRSPFVRAVFRAEGEALAFGLGGWFRRTPPAREGRFSSLRGRPWGAAVAALAFLFVVETAALHVALATRSHAAAWIASALSVYTLVWLLGDYHALRLTGIDVLADGLAVRVGLRWRVHVPWALVADVVATEARPEGKQVLDGRILRTDVLVTLRAEVVAHGPFGLTRRVRHLALAVDAPAAFVAAVRARLDSPSIER